ncbi:unnamed protein product [marine sediment metagenome]|uniref:Uncharacterized protein n=2 Tax=marine sediment metagenome TaxID=412755 RepID=X1APC7_9ZZZZ
MNKKILGYISLSLGIVFLVGSIMIGLGYLYDNLVVINLGIVAPLLYLASICFCMGIKMKFEKVRE